MSGDSELGLNAKVVKDSERVDEKFEHRCVSRCVNWGSDD